MRGNLQKALENADTTYNELKAIAGDMVSIYTKDIDATIKEVSSKVENLSNEEIRKLILKLSMQSYTFSEVKEKSALKAELAEALRKEAYATTFNGTDGSVALRENTATIETSDEVLVETIYDSVSSTFKVKLDEIHRIVDSLKTVLMTRLQEMKLASTSSDAQE